MRLPIILDTDPGIDDAAAIAAALFAPELDLKLMTTVAGNVSLEKTTRNALQLLHFWNANIPVDLAWKAITLLNISASRWQSRRFRQSAMC